jgi:hypothetical protein
MTNIEFGLIWALSFLLYLLIYTYWIPLKTQKRIETWLRDSESDETLLLALEVIVKRIREQTLVDFQEFMLPQARENLQKFWSGAMGNVAKELKKTDEGGQLSLMHSVADSLKNEAWYVQALGSKLMPILAEGMQKTKSSNIKPDIGMGLRK